MRARRTAANRHRRCGLWVLLLTSCTATPEQDERAVPAVDLTPRVVLETTAGNIVMELDRERAPATVENFLLHVRSKFYDGLVFHRVEAAFVIQAGSVTAEMNKRTSSVQPIQSEADNGLRNEQGTVAMARTDYPHSATSEFFINLVDNTAKLDFRDAGSWQGWGYAVFGRVVDGMDVVAAIGRVPVRPRGEHRAMPVEPVVIRRASIVTDGS